MSLAPLDPTQLERQRVGGVAFREAVHQAVGELLQTCRAPAIALSGGVDSTIVLHEMLAAGARPHVVTFAAPGSAPGSDARRALALARHHGLGSTVVALESDVEVLAARTADIVELHESLSSRADIEVMHLMGQMGDAALAAGCDALFTGISDRAVHLVSRLWETSARRGRTTAAECDAARTIALVDPQFLPMVADAAAKGLALCAPLALAACTAPYLGLSWQEMNTPRNKEIARRAYPEVGAGAKAAGVAITVGPMQCSDSGARDYFDRAATTSALARTLAGREVTSAKALYNSLLAARGRGGSNFSVDYWPGFRRNTSGMPPEQGYTDPVAVGPDGLAVADPEDLLDIGEDRRLDCWGNPFSAGDQVAMTGCARARARLCGTWRPNVAYSFAACEGFTTWYGEAIAQMRRVEGFMAGQDVGAPALALVGALHTRWAGLMDQRAEQVAASAQVAGVAQAIAGAGAVAGAR